MPLELGTPLTAWLFPETGCLGHPPGCWETVRCPRPVRQARAASGLWKVRRHRLRRPACSLRAALDLPPGGIPGRTRVQREGRRLRDRDAVAFHRVRQREIRSVRSRTCAWLLPPMLMPILPGHSLSEPPGSTSRLPVAMALPCREGQISLAREPQGTPTGCGMPPAPGRSPGSATGVTRPVLICHACPSGRRLCGSAAWHHPPNRNAGPLVSSPICAAAAPATRRSRWAGSAPPRPDDPVIRWMSPRAPVQCQLFPVLSRWTLVGRAI